jgi:hypothetical protein
VVCFVQGCGAGGAAVHAGGRVVLVVFARAGILGAFLAEDAELFYGVLVSVCKVCGESRRTRRELRLPLALCLLHGVIRVVGHVARRSK